MYLRGNKWTVTRRSRRPNTWRIVLLVVLIGIGLYVNQVVVPATPPLFVPTATPTHSPESYVNQAQELSKAGKLTLAIDTYKEAIATDPGNPANYVELARLQVLTGDYEAAIVNSQNALLKNPNNPQAHAVQGWALGFQEKYTEGELEIKKALDLDPNSALAHAYYAELLINQNDYALLEKAAAESKRALDLDPSLMETHRIRGIVLYNTNNLPEAIDEFKKALAINKNIADIHLYLGITYKAAENYDLAEESLLAAYALNPKDTIGLTELSRTYLANGRFAQAAQYAEEAVRVEPTDPKLHGNLGIMYYKMEDFEKAIPELALAVQGGTYGEENIAVEGIPLDYGRIEEYYWYYGFALTRMNRCSESVPIFRALLTGVPNDEIAVYNANEGLAACQAGIESGDSGSTSTEEPALTEEPATEEPSAEATVEP